MGQETEVQAPPATSERVASILAAAGRVIVREGAHGLRMASVADEAQVSKALVHYYFSTRKELMRSAFAWSEEQWEAALEREIARLDTGAERVERVLLMSIDTSYRGWVRRLRGLIEDGRRDGSIRTDVGAGEASWRLAAAADGFDSMLYLRLLGRRKAREHMLRIVRGELAPR